jgi:hypothetical protein
VELAPADYVGDMVDIQSTTLEQKITASESFLLFVSSPSCTLCQSFTTHVIESTTNLQYRVYRIYLSTLPQDSIVFTKVTFTPALLLFKNGKIYQILDSTKSGDTQYFASTEALSQWIGRYVQFDE